MTDHSQATPARPKLDDEAFEAFMRKRRPVSPVWTMSGLDGYLTALIIGPKFIDPRQWIPLLTGADALNAPMETTEHQAVQTIVAEYNRISQSLAETPKDHRPRFSRVDAQTYDSLDWRTGFLIATDFSQKQWRPVIRGHAVTGDIIAPIRELSYDTGAATIADAAAVADALVKIRSYFMPKRSKQKF
jgi:uncharacterized protein